MLSGSGEGKLAGGNISFQPNGDLSIVNATLSLPIFQPAESQFFDVANSKFVCMISNPTSGSESTSDGQTHFIGPRFPTGTDAGMNYGTYEANTTIKIFGTASTDAFERPLKETIVVENAYVVGGISASSLNFGDIIEADKPIALVEDAAGSPGKGKEANPLNFAGTEFLTYGDRNNPIEIFMYSPFNSGSVTMSVSEQNPSRVNGTIGGEYFPFASSSIPADGTLILKLRVL